MPLVLVRYSHAVDQPTLRRLVPVLCKTIADRLSYTDDDKSFKVTPEMVKIRFSVSSPLDVNTPDLYVEVEARAFKARIPLVEQYAAEVGQAVEAVLPPNITASVWFKLCHAGWHSNARPGGTSPEA